MSRRPHPLADGEAARTLAQRMTGRVDRLRQLNTRFGLRSRRVFLVHTRWDGEQRGEGEESVVSRVELLPTPQVSDATAVNQRPWSGGTLPEGSLRVDQISAGRYTPDVLTGARYAEGEFAGQLVHRAKPVGGDGLDPRVPDQVDFFYEVVEDSRGDRPPYRERFRLLGQPYRKEGSFYFGVLLEAASEPLDREGESTAQRLDEA